MGVANIRWAWLLSDGGGLYPVGVAYIIWGGGGKGVITGILRQPQKWILQQQKNYLIVSNEKYNNTRDIEVV